MRMTKQQRQMFRESYRLAGQGNFPTFADLLYLSDLRYILVRSSKQGAVQTFRERTPRGQAIVRRNWMRRFPKLFTKQMRKEAGL